MNDEKINILIKQYRDDLNKFLIQINPQFTQLSLEQLVSQFLNLTQNPNLNEQTKKILPQILSNIYSISFETYKKVARYLSKENKELYKYLNKKVERRPESIKDLLDIVSMFNKLEEVNLNFVKTTTTTEVYCFLLGQPAHYNSLLSQFERVNSFYYKYKVNHTMYHFFNCLGVKNDFNQHSGTSFEDVNYYISNHMKEISPSYILSFGLCASLRDDSPQNTIYLPSSFNFMFPKGKMLQIVSNDLLSIKDSNVLIIDNIFKDISKVIPNQKKGIKKSSKNISVSNLYTKAVYGNSTLLKSLSGTQKEIKLKYIEKIDKKFKLGNKILSKKIDSLEMESYKIIKRFKNVKNIGLYLHTADQILVEENNHFLNYNNEGSYTIPLDFQAYIENVSFILNFYFSIIK